MGIFSFGKKQHEKVEKLYASNRSFQSVGTRTSDGRYVSAEELHCFIEDFLSKLLEVHNFEYLKSKKTFKRTTQTGCDEISISFIDHVHYHVRFCFMKRIDCVQKIITAFEYENGFNTIKNYKEHSTICVCDKVFTGQNNTEIVSYAVLEKTLRNLLPLIESKILPYFEKLNSIDFLNQTLNYPEKDKNNPFSYWAIQSSNNIIAGLIVAKILESPDYDKLLEKYIAQYPLDMVLKGKITKLNDYLKQKNLKEI